MEERLLDINDLAGILKIPAKTIRNKLSNGTWPIRPLRIGKSIRWRTSDNEKFLQLDSKDVGSIGRSRVGFG